MVVEDPPELVGGMEALQKSVSYPQMAKEAGIEGRVIVQFVVDKSGDVTNPKVMRGVHETLNEAALEAVKQQEFKPGQQDGAPVKVQMSVPVTFRLPDGTSEGNALPSQVEKRTGKERIILEIRPDGKVLLNGDIASLENLPEQILREVPNPKNSTLSIKVRSGAPQRLKNEVLRKLQTIDMANRSPESRDSQG
jgi:TonB family protein